MATEEGTALGEIRADLVGFFRKGAEDAPLHGSVNVGDLLEEDPIGVHGAGLVLAQHMRNRYGIPFDDAVFDCVMQ